MERRTRFPDTANPILSKINQELSVSLSTPALAFLRKFESGQTDGITCWRSESVIRKAGSKIEGLGLFAIKDIKPEEILAIKSGRVVDKNTIKENAKVIEGSHQQIGLSEFLTGLTPEEVDKNLVGYNHSCEPNAKVVLVEGVPLAFLLTKRTIKKGEEITVDYSVSQTSSTHRIFVCKCQSPRCRKVIQPDSDWLEKGFQKANAGEFPYFIQNDIDTMERMNEEELKAKLRQIYTLRTAGAISLLSQEIEILGKEIDSMKNASRLIKMLKIYRYTSIVKEKMDLENILFEYAKLFVMVCPFANIEDFGVRRNDPETLRQNLDKVVGFAKGIDEVFN